jgi:Zn-dependent protease
MPDMLSWSWSVGRLGRKAFRVHALCLVFALAMLLSAVFRPRTSGQPVLEMLAWLGLLSVAVLLHELGHHLAATTLGHDADDVCLWPLGNLSLAAPTVASRSIEATAVACAGLLTSGALAVGSALVLSLFSVRMQFLPFGGEHGGAPLTGDSAAVATYSPAWWIGGFGYVNWVIFLANLIPALPFDMGRILRSHLSGHARESEIWPYVARTSAVILGLVGLFRIYFNKPGGWLLLAIAFLIEAMVRQEARVLEEGGFYEEGLFGYDFSQGYTSLEPGTPVVRPPRESALRRWRRRRSDARRLRVEAQSAAEEARLDEILEKLHRDGRGALTVEEQRFLVRQSARIRSRRLQGS